jgi:pilus assembly protein CpaB
MKKQRIILIVGVVLALAAMVMTKIYIDQQVRTRDEARRRALAKQFANQTAVLVAKEDIAKGKVIDSGMLETAILPNQYVQPQAVTSLDRISGMVVIADISKGEQVTLSKLSSPREAGGGSLAMATPVGKRAITISVDNIASLAGMIKPGDYVDVMALVPVPAQTADGGQTAQAAVIPMFQNVLILAVGQEVGSASKLERRYKEEEKKEASPLITLALTSQEANLIAFVQEQGKIRLTLRSPVDSRIEPTQLITWETLFQYVMPQEMRKPEPTEQVVPAEPTEYIEVYRGLNREKMPLSK